jgi:hypothetical protein
MIRKASPLDLAMTAMMPLVDDPEFMAWWIAIGIDKRLDILTTIAERLDRELEEEY